jgi:hypothetical protein
MNQTTIRIAAVGLFCILFMLIGWLFPVLFATYAPQQYFIEMNSFTVEDASVDDRTHTLCFDRSVKDVTTGTVFTELYLVDDGEQRIKLISREQERAFPNGQTTVRVESKIPDIVEPGTYTYQRTYKIELAQGRVTRTFSFSSEKFTLHNDNKTTQIKTFC